MRPTTSIVPAPRVLCSRCEGKGVLPPPFRPSFGDEWEGRDDEEEGPAAAPPDVECSQCKGAGGWQERALDWEPIEGRCAVTPEGTATVRPASVTERLAVPGGWLVRSVRYYPCNDGGGVGVGLTFVPDPEGAWQPVAPHGGARE